MNDKERIKRIIKSQLPQTEVKIADPTFGSHLDITFRGRKNKFMFSDSSSNISRSH